MPQGMVHQHEGQQRFGDGRGADAHAGVVAALGDDFGALAVDVDGLARADDGTGGLDGDQGLDVLPAADAAQDAAGVVAGEALGRERIAMRGAALDHAGEARADLHRLHRIEAHERMGDVGIELVVERLAQAHGHARGLHADAGAARITGLAQRVHVGLQGRYIGHRSEERVVVHVVPAFERDLHLADLGHAGAKARAVFFRQPLLGDGAGRHGGRRQPGRGSAPAARIADAVLVPVGIVGMARAEALGDVRVILAALVGVADQQGDGRARGTAFIDAGEDLHRIGLGALGDVAAGAGPAAVQVGLDVGLRQFHARRATVDHAANGRAVGFTEVGDCE